MYIIDIKRINSNLFEFTLGAFRFTITLSDSDKINLLETLTGASKDAGFQVNIAPLNLPAGFEVLNEETLAVRKRVID